MNLPHGYTPRQKETNSETQTVKKNKTKHIKKIIQKQKEKSHENYYRIKPCPHHQSFAVISARWVAHLKHTKVAVATLPYGAVIGNPSCQLMARVRSSAKGWFKRF